MSVKNKVQSEIEQIKDEISSLTKRLLFLEENYKINVTKEINEFYKLFPVEMIITMIDSKREEVCRYYFRHAEYDPKLITARLILGCPCFGLYFGTKWSNLSEIAKSNIVDQINKRIKNN